MCTIKKEIIVALALLGLTSFAQAENRTLSNLEHERVAFFEMVTNQQLKPAEREQQIAVSQRRLMDLERMVIRDDRLLGSSDPLVKKAFGDYDSTFLVHASVEAEQHIVDFWLQQLQLDTQSILSSQRGRR